jgi:hypothetical protein
MMKHLLIAAAVLASASPALAKGSGYHAPRYHAPKSQPAFANVGKISKSTNLPMTKPVSGYVRKDGAYVQPYVKSK